MLLYIRRSIVGKGKGKSKGKETAAPPPTVPTSGSAFDTLFAADVHQV